MIKTKEIKTCSEGDEYSFFIKKGYLSQEKNNTKNDNREENYWDVNRIINSSLNQAQSYIEVKDRVVSRSKNILEIGSGTLLKQNIYFFGDPEYSANYFAIDQKETHEIVNLLGLSNKKVKPVIVDLENEEHLNQLVNYFETNNIELDTIICFDVIEHLFNPSFVLDFIKKLKTTKDCKVYISTPERDLKRGFDCTFSNKPEHVREWNEKEILKLLNYFSLKNVKTKIIQDTKKFPNRNETIFVECSFY